MPSEGKPILLVSNTVDDIYLKSVFIFHSENPRALKNYTESILPCSINGMTKPGWQTICLQHGLLNILSPLLDLLHREKIPLYILVAIINEAGYSGTLME